MDFLFSFIRFIKNRKKYWLVPVLIVMAILGTLIVLGSGTVISPFIYTVF